MGLLRHRQTTHLNYRVTPRLYLPPTSVQNIIHAEGVPRLRFDQDDVRFVLRRVRCGLPTIWKVEYVQKNP
jgi:hypothetical protein